MVQLESWVTWNQNMLMTLLIQNRGSTHTQAKTYQSTVPMESRIPDWKGLATAPGEMRRVQVHNKKGY